MSTTFTLHQISVSDMDNNVYLIASEGKGLLIDAAADATGQPAEARGSDS